MNPIEFQSAKQSRAKQFADYFLAKRINIECIGCESALPVGTEPVEVIVSDGAIDLTDQIISNVDDLPRLMTINGKAIFSPSLVESLNRNQKFLSLNLNGPIEINGAKNMSQEQREQLVRKLLESNGVSVAIDPASIEFT